MHVVHPTRVLRAVLVAALTASALVAVAAAPSGAATACQRTFTNATSTPLSGFTLGPPLPPLFIPLPIPGVGISSVTVGAGTISDVDVAVHITHPATESLTVSVQQGIGVPVVLKNVGGTTGANFAGTIFDDEAGQDITAGAPPYAGRYRPSQPLTGYDGTAAAGTWQLTVSNLALATGTIDSWSAVVTYAGTCDYDSDGVEDHRDSCLGKAGHTASGCPAASRSLSAKYKRHKFRGVLSSTVRGCTAGRAVSIWKVRRGPDRQMGAATSASDGRYALKRAKHRGRYYAKSPRVVLAGVAECPAVTSATFRIR